MCEANGSWNNWEKEGGSTNEILRRAHKQGFGMIWLEKRGCVWLKQMVSLN